MTVAGLVILAGAFACFAPATSPTVPAPITTIIVATIQAITAQAPTSSEVEPTSTLSAPTPSPTPVPPTRIDFPGGATTAMVSGPIDAGQTLSYVLGAGQGQPMLVHVDSPQNDVMLAISTQGGTSLLNASARETSWKGTLPQTEDYIVEVHGSGAAEQFTLTVEIVSRITFAAGPDAIKVTGKTVGGYTVAYTIFVQKGQKMEVAVYGAGHTPGLAVWGYADGKTYLAPSSNKTNLAFTAPRTQDYILEVIPTPGQAVNFVIYIKMR